MTSVDQEKLCRHRAAFGMLQVQSELIYNFSKSTWRLSPCSDMGPSKSQRFKPGLSHFQLTRTITGPRSKDPALPGEF